MRGGRAQVLRGGRTLGLVMPTTGAANDFLLDVIPYSDVKVKKVSDVFVQLVEPEGEPLQGLLRE